MILIKENHTVLKIYSYLWEIFIGFGAFIIFFGVFIKYYFHQLEEKLLQGYIQKSLSFYKPIINEINKYINLKDNLKGTLLNLEDLNKNVEENEKTIITFNSEYDNKLISYIFYVLGIFLVVLLLPILTGIIPIGKINFTYITASFILHIILVTLFEYILLWHIIPINNPIKLYKAL